MNRRSFLNGFCTSPLALAAAAQPALSDTFSSEELQRALAEPRGSGFVTYPPGVTYRPAKSLTAKPADFGRDKGDVYGDPDEAKARLLDALMASDSLGIDLDVYGNCRRVEVPDDRYRSFPEGKVFGMGTVVSGGRSLRDCEDSLIGGVADAIRRYRHHGVYFAVEFVGFLLYRNEWRPEVDCVECRFRPVRLPENPATAE